MTLGPRTIKKQRSLKMRQRFVLDCGLHRGYNHKNERLNKTIKQEHNIYKNIIFVKEMPTNYYYRLESFDKQNDRYTDQEQKQKSFKKICYIHCSAFKTIRSSQ